jgi:hypothetical protein
LTCLASFISNSFLKGLSVSLSLLALPFFTWGYSMLLASRKWNIFSRTSAVCRSLLGDAVRKSATSLTAVVTCAVWRMSVNLQAATRLRLHKHNCGCLIMTWQSTLFFSRFTFHSHICEKYAYFWASQVSASLTKALKSCLVL